MEIKDEKPYDIKNELTLEYHGKLAEMGRMDSYDVAGYIIAFSDFLGIVSKTEYGEKITLRTEIQGFRKDSFDIDFSLNIAGILANLFYNNPSYSPSTIIDLIKESIKAWIHLEGRPPKSIIPYSKQANMSEIVNQNGQINYISNSVVNIITNEDAGKAVKKFINQPLSDDLSYIRINSKSSSEVVDIKKDEGAFFHPLSIENNSIENDIEMRLTIETLTFIPQNKWRFYDGNGLWYANILDEDFMERVRDRKEIFGNGDILTCMVHIKQFIDENGKLKVEYSIRKVLSHAPSLNISDSELF